jgi:hypothetical protein
MNHIWNVACPYTCEDESVPTRNLLYERLSGRHDGIAALVPLLAAMLDGMTRDAALAALERAGLHREP